MFFFLLCHDTCIFCRSKKALLWVGFVCRWGHGQKCVLSCFLRPCASYFLVEEEKIWESGCVFPHFKPSRNPLKHIFPLKLPLLAKRYITQFLFSIFAEAAKRLLKRSRWWPSARRSSPSRAPTPRTSGTWSSTSWKGLRRGPNSSSRCRITSHPVRNVGKWKC